MASAAVAATSAYSRPRRCGLPLKVRKAIAKAAKDRPTSVLESTELHQSLISSRIPISMKPIGCTMVARIHQRSEGCRVAAKWRRTANKSRPIRSVSSAPRNSAVRMSNCQPKAGLPTGNALCCSASYVPGFR